MDLPNVSPLSPLTPSGHDPMLSQTRSPWQRFSEQPPSPQVFSPNIFPSQMYSPSVPFLDENPYKHPLESVENEKNVRPRLEKPEDSYYRRLEERVELLTKKLEEETSKRKQTDEKLARITEVVERLQQRNGLNNPRLASLPLDHNPQSQRELNRLRENQMGAHARLDPVAFAVPAPKRIDFSIIQKFIDEKNIDQALNVLYHLEVEKGHPDKAQTIYYLATCYFELKNYNDVINEARAGLALEGLDDQLRFKFLKLRSDSYLISLLCPNFNYLGLARNYLIYAKKDLEAMLKLKISVDMQSTRLNLGRVCFLKGLSKSALKYFGNIIQACADNNNNLKYLALAYSGLLYSKIKDNTFAIINLNEAIKLNDKDVLAYVFRSEVYESCGELIASILDKEMAFALNAEAAKEAFESLKKYPSEYIQK